VQIHRLEISLAKAEYLLNFTTAPGEGGNKHKFWYEIMGFHSAELLQAALQAEVSLEMLQLRGQNAFGELYQASVTITGPSGKSFRIRTNWIVRFGEDLARFVTAFPERRRQQE
jgi:hypothetical protein